VALDTDEITDEGFQSFSLLWESVREMLNERQRKFGNQPGGEPSKKQSKAKTKTPGQTRKSNSDLHAVLNKIV
jgi:hypothetical protein